MVINYSLLLGLRVDSVHEKVLVFHRGKRVKTIKMINCRPVLLDSPIEMNWSRVPDDLTISKDAREVSPREEF
jgi:hypothetical protein